MELTQEIAEQIHAEVMKAQGLAGQGNFAKAELILNSALELYPEHPDTNQVLGLIYLHQKKFEVAKKHLEISLKTVPEQPYVLASLGQALLALKDSKEAEKIFLEAGRQMPDLGAAWGFLSEISDKKDLPNVIGKIFNAFLVVENIPAENRIQLGFALTTCLEKLGQTDEAADTRQYFTFMQEVVKEGGKPPAVVAPPEDVKSALLRVKDHLGVANFRRAEKICRGLLEKDPNQSDALLLMGVTKSETNDYDAGVDYFRKGLKLAPAQPRFWVKLGVAYNNIREFDKADHCHKMAILYDPNLAEALYRLGTMALGRGEEELAKTYILRAIAIMPGFSQSYDLLRRLKGFQVDDAYLAALQKNAEDVERSRIDAIFANYILGAHYAKAKDYDKVVHHVTRANFLQKEGAPVTIDKNVDLVKFSKDVFTKDLLKNQADNKSKIITPIFIVGLPRSGSTLIEQILSRHSDVAAGDEIHFLHTHLLNEVEKITGKPYPEALDQIDSKAWGEIGQSYQNRLARIAPKTPFITDKLLSNALYIGVIRMAMPWAKIIHINRNPMDRALSIYSNNFNEGLAYTFDLKHMARNTRLTKSAMDFWRDLAPDYILDVEYEDMVNDLEGQTRRILEYCGLEWDPACLEFYKSDRTVLTISVEQVHKPIYASSIGKWKNYTELLEPFKKEMGDLIYNDGFLVRKR